MSEEKPKKSAPAVPEWLAKRKAALAEKTQTRKFDLQFWTFDQGETKVKLFPEIEPKDDDSGDFGKRILWTVKPLVKTAFEPKYLISCSDALSERLMACIEKKILEPTIIRVGEGKKTRYGIKELIGKD